MKTLLTEGDWQDVFHTVLPTFEHLITPSPSAQEVAMAFTRYRSACQCELAKWMVAREHEKWLEIRGNP